MSVSRNRTLSVLMLCLLMPLLLGVSECDPDPIDPIPQFKFAVKDGTLYVNNEPYVPRGTYFWPDYSILNGHNPLDDVLATGADTVVAYYEYVKPDAGLQPQLNIRQLRDGAEARGMRFFVGQPKAPTVADLTDAQLRELLDRTYQEVKGSEAFMGWMVDEPGNNGMDVQLTIRYIQAARAVAPERLIWVNFASDFVDYHGTEGDLVQIAALAHVVGGDLYPVPAGHYGVPSYPNWNPASPAQQLDDLRSLVPDKPMWMFVQGNRWREFTDNPPADDRFPTLEEVRMMAYNHLIHGARGIVYFGIAHWGSPQGFAYDTPIWAQHIPQVNGELEELFPAFVHGVPADGFCSNAAVSHAMMSYGGQLLVVAANESSEAQTVDLTVAGATQLTIKPFFADDSQWTTIAGDTFQASLNGYSAHAWRVIVQ